MVDSYACLCKHEYPHTPERDIDINMCRVSYKLKGSVVWLLAANLVDDLQRSV